MKASRRVPKPKKPKNYDEKVAARIADRFPNKSLGEVASEEEARKLGHVEASIRRHVSPFDRDKQSFGETKYHRMPFGKYKDWPMEEVPTDYLRWMLESGEDDGSGLMQTVQEEYRARPDGY